VSGERNPLAADRRIGIVISVPIGTPPVVEISIGGDTTTTVEVPFLRTYEPVIGDVVIVLSVGPDHLVIGSAATGPLTVGTPIPLLGTYDPLVPIRRFWKRATGTSDGTNGLISGIWAPPETAMSIMNCTPCQVDGGTMSALWALRRDLSSLSNLVWQSHTFAGAPVISKAYDLTMTIDYQPA
jgi:hypothetical protein